MSRDLQSMQTKIRDFKDLESSYLDSVALQRMQGRTPAEESTTSGFGSTYQPSRALLSSSMAEQSRSRTQKMILKGNPRGKLTLQASLRHPALTKFLTQGGILQTSNSWQ